MNSLSARRARSSAAGARGRQSRRYRARVGAAGSPPQRGRCGRRRPPAPDTAVAPTRGVSSSVICIHALLQQLLAVSVLLVTHDIDEALYLSDRIVLMDGVPGPARARSGARRVRGQPRTAARTRRAGHITPETGEPARGARDLGKHRLIHEGVLGPKCSHKPGPRRGHKWPEAELQRTLRRRASAPG